MATEEINEPIERNDDLQRSLERGGVDVKEQKKKEPIYKIVNHDEHIAVSRHHGKVWQGRRDRALKKRKKLYEPAWDQALKYYGMDQSPHRDEDDLDRSQTDSTRFASKRNNSHTENIVFANTSSLVPMVYAKNPVVEVTQTIPENEAYVSDVAEPFMNNLLTRQSYPRLPLKAPLRRATVCTTLTNVAYVEIGYTFKAEASDEALQTLQNLSKQLSEAKSSKAIEEIEGRIMAIEDKVDFLRPEGPWVKGLAPKQVVRDSGNTDEDLSSDNWIMVWDYMPTRYLQAVYGTSKNGEKRMLFKPTHVLPAEKNQGSSHEGRNSAEIEIDSYELLQDDSKGGDFGYDDDKAFKDAQMTKVWKIWDKTTRRLYMYADNDWTWPVWVWNDPYHLVDFYPIMQLTFYTDPIEGLGNSEVSYYLDQQDSINEKNSQFAELRNQVRFNLAYDQNKITPHEIEAVLDGTRPRAVGVDVPEGMKLQDFYDALVPPVMKYLELFDPAQDHQAVHRISSVSASMQGQEFRTNTTNKAIEYYNSTQATRLDEKIDAIEDFIGRICWNVYQMCVQFMTPELVAIVLGEQRAQGWKQMTAIELQKTMGGMQVVGGSTQKPNTEAKKRMAIEVGQVLGQFASAMPQVASVMLKVFERAFDEVVISKDEWSMINQMMQQQTATAGQPPTGGAAGNGAPPQDIQQLLQQLPPEAQQAIQQAVQQGVPPEEAIKRVMQMMQQSQPTQ